jgi:hypothetical protein
LLIKLMGTLPCIVAIWIITDEAVYGLVLLQIIDTAVVSFLAYYTDAKGRGNRLVFSMAALVVPYNLEIIFEAISALSLLRITVHLVYI